MTDSEAAAVVDRAVRYGVRVQANQRPHKLDDETIRKAHKHHLSGLNLRCLGRFYGVRGQYLGERFRELDLPVRNYSHKGERVAALAADGERDDE